MVVYQPGAWFDDVLDGLIDQDYSNLKLLFLVAGDTTETAARIRAKVPNAFVRATQANLGFGPAVNEVLTLVEGDNGFFCLLHDDVALEPAAIRLMVEELYRSNAGIVGPKLVQWDDASVLQHVGLGVDRFGEIDPLIEPGEVDQEQHDAVRDVFALPSACLLVRADLFRTLGGFDSSIDYYGDDVDLCWRTHLSGARVVVVPAARARHRERLPERRPDLHHDTLRARHRMRTVITHTGARRLPMVSLQLVVITIAELVAGVFTGTMRQAWASFTALIGAIVRTPTTIARRRHLSTLRQVPDSEVAGLQLRGSARLSSFIRSRQSRIDPDASTERRWRQTAGSIPAITWLCVAVAVVLGSRELISGGVPSVGEFLEFPVSPRTMFSDYLSGWWGHGLGSSSPVPTGVALIALGSTVTLFHMGALQTVAIIGAMVAGLIGMWRLATLFPTPRARLTALVVYAAVPLPSELLSVGRWGALACYGATPWVVHLLRRAAGIETTHTALAAGSTSPDEVERMVRVSGRKRLRLGAQLALVGAVVFAFAPSFLLLLVGVAFVLAVTTLLAGGSWRASVLMLGTAIAAAIAAFIANLPWSTSLFGDGGWNLVAGVPEVSSGSLGVARLARFGVGNGEFGVLAIALMVPVASALLLARSWRLTWAIRGAGLVVAFGWLAVLDDRAIGGIRLAEPGVLLAPVAVGVAIAAACIAAAFEQDVLSGSFGWRQPLGIISAAAIVVGILPGALALGNGRWNTPEVTLASVIGQLPTNPPEGDYRVLWVGDPDVLPVAAWEYRPGIGYAVTDDGPLGVYETWPGRPSNAERQIAGALDAIATQSTLRAGRLLAPLAIRYIVVPLADGAISTTERPLAPPDGLLDALDDQLDLGRPLTRPLNFIVYENTAWTPTRGELTQSGAAASAEAGDEVLATADLSGSVPFAVGARDRGDAIGPVQAGTLHVAVPTDDRWQLSVDGQTIASRSAFGSTMGYDIPTPGTATLHYNTPTSRTMLLALQLVVWLALVMAAGRFQPSSLLAGGRRRRRGVQTDAVLLQLTDPFVEPTGDGVPWMNGAAEAGDADSDNDHLSGDARDLS